MKAAGEGKKPKEKVMKINGYTLQQAVREAQQERDLAAARFNPSLTKFPDETKPNPVDVAKTYSDAEERLARLQVTQARYNLAVAVDVQGEKMTLHEAIKRVGGAGRLEKMWRSAAAEKQDRYVYGNTLTRDRDAVVAERQVSFDQADEFRRTASKKAAALRAAIQLGNAQEVELQVDVPLG